MGGVGERKGGGGPKLGFCAIESCATKQVFWQERSNAAYTLRGEAGAWERMANLHTITSMMGREVATERTAAK